MILTAYETIGSPTLQRELLGPSVGWRLMLLLFCCFVVVVVVAVVVVVVVV